MTRRAGGLLAGALVLGLVLVGGAAFLAFMTRPVAPTTALAAPRFLDETTAAGIDHTYEGGFAYALGGGVAVFDCDEDGRPDLYLAGGAGSAALYRNRSPVGGALRFERLTDPASDQPAVTGAYPVDIDGDGHVDLAVLRVGEDLLLRGLGDCRFERANETWSFAGGDDQTMAFSATWEGDARLPTLAIGHYLKLDESGEPTYECDDNLLIRPDAAGTSYGTGEPLAPGYCPLSMLFSDWDLSGRRDLRVSNDRHYYDFVNGEEQLWRIADGEPRLYTADDGWVRVQVFGMGIASHDLTGDGYPEIYLTSQGLNKLETLLAGPSQPTYRDIAVDRGADARKPFTGGDPLPSTAWHPEFRDVNNDGFVDLFISKGNIDQQADYAARDPSNLLLGGPDGMFREVAEEAGILSFAKGRGAALADLNLDGLLDLIESNYGDPVRVWRNGGAGAAGVAEPMGHWLALRVGQEASNRDAIGSWVEVRVGDHVQRRELTVGGGHVGGQLGWVHFGLGPATEAQVRVTWPDGEVGSWMTVGADQFVDVVRGADAATPWAPPGG